MAKRLVKLGALLLILGSFRLHAEAASTRFFANESEGVVFILPEEGGDAVAVDPGARYEGGIDAWIDPQLARENSAALVFKVVDGISVLYSRDLEVILKGGSWFERLGQKIEGGWKDAAWLDSNPYFLDFFNAVMAAIRS
jgi:hypothetical protein